MNKYTGYKDCKGNKIFVNDNLNYTYNNIDHSYAQCKVLENKETNKYYLYEWSDNCDVKLELTPYVAKDSLKINIEEETKCIQ